MGVASAEVLGAFNSVAIEMTGIQCWEDRCSTLRSGRLVRVPPSVASVAPGAAALYSTELQQR